MPQSKPVPVKPVPVMICNCLYYDLEHIKLKFEKLFRHLESRGFSSFEAVEWDGQVPLSLSLEDNLAIIYISFSISSSRYNMPAVINYGKKNGLFVLGHNQIIYSPKI